MADQSDRNCVVPAHRGMTRKPYPLIGVDDALAPDGVEIGERLFRDGFQGGFSCRLQFLNAIARSGEHVPGFHKVRFVAERAVPGNDLGVIVRKRKTFVGGGNHAGYCAACTGVDVGAEGLSWHEIRLSGTFWLMTVAFMLVGASVHACIIHLPQLIRDHQGITSSAALATSVLGLALLLGEPVRDTSLIGISVHAWPRLFLQAPPLEFS